MIYYNLFQLMGETNEAAKLLRCYSDTWHACQSPYGLEPQKSGVQELLRQNEYETHERSKQTVIDAVAALGLHEPRVVVETKDGVHKAYKAFPKIYQAVGTSPETYYMLAPVDHLGASFVPADYRFVTGKETQAVEDFLFHGGSNTPPSVYLMQNTPTALPKGYTPLDPNAPKIHIPHCGFRTRRGMSPR